MKILGLRIAPLRVPFRRRLQTLAVWFLCSLFLMFGPVGTLLWIYGFFTRYYFLSLMYLVWMYYDWDQPKQGGRAIKWIRYWRIWRYFANYFPVKLVKTADIDPNKNYIFGFHPHGIIVVGCTTNFLSEATGFSNLFPGITPRVLTLKENVHFPMQREILMAIGVCSVSKESIQWILNNEGKGNAAFIVVGGAAEALDARPGMATLTIKRRKGFVRQAIINGANLVPIYSFGENDLYDQLHNPAGSPLRILQEKMTKYLAFSPPIFHGRGVFNYSLGYLPYRKPIYTVVGKPIEVVRNANPSQAEVDRLHNEYLQQLKEIFDKHKGKYGNPNQELEFT